jgi:hypothetical protein
MIPPKLCQFGKMFFNTKDLTGLSLAARGVYCGADDRLGSLADMAGEVIHDRCRSPPPTEVVRLEVGL